MNLLALTGLPQKIALGGFAAILLVLGSHDVVEVIKVHRLAAANLKLDTRINDPRTGYVVKLAQAETNTAVCTTAVAHQTAVIKAIGNRDAATVAAVQARYNSEHVARVQAENSAAAFLMHKPQGNSVADRVGDVDAQILGDLK